MVGNRSTGAWRLVTAVLLAAALTAPAGAAALELIDPRCEASAGSPCAAGLQAGETTDGGVNVNVITDRTRDSSTAITDVEFRLREPEIWTVTVTASHSADTRALVGELEIVQLGGTTSSAGVDACRSGNLRDSPRPSSCETQASATTIGEPCVVAVAETQGAELEPAPDVFAVGASQDRAVVTHCAIAG